MNAKTDPLSWEQFRRLVAQGLHVDESKVVPEASFVEDLVADSIRLVELLARLRETGIEIPIEEAWNIQTVGDAYDLASGHAHPNPDDEK